MPNVLLVLGDVTHKQYEPLRMAMVRDGLSPVVVRVSSQHRDSELVRSLVMFKNGLTVGGQLSELERACLVSLLSEKGATLQDVRVVLTEFRPDMERESTSPWVWVSDYLPREDVAHCQLRLTQDGKNFWLDGTDFVRLPQVKIPA